MSGFNPVSPDVVKFEMRGVGTESAGTQTAKKKGFFGRFFSGLLKVAAAPLSVLGMAFPPAALGAAGAYGLSNTIDMAQSRSAANDVQQASQASQGTFLPGVNMNDLASASGAAPMGGRASVAPTTAMQQRVVDVLYARNDVMMDSTAAFRQGKGVASV